MAADPRKHPLLAMEFIQAGMNSMLHGCWHHMCPLAFSRHTSMHVMKYLNSSSKGSRQAHTRPCVTNTDRHVHAATR